MRRAAPPEVCRLGGIDPWETIKVATSAGPVAEREVQSIEADILNGSLPPDSRLWHHRNRGALWRQTDAVARRFVLARPTCPQARSASGAFVSSGCRGRTSRKIACPSYRRRARSVAAQHNPLTVSLVNGVVPFDRNAPWSKHEALVGVSTRSKPSWSKRLPSRCEKAGQADDVLRTFALKPDGKQGERDDRER